MAEQLDFFRLQADADGYECAEVARIFNTHTVCCHICHAEDYRYLYEKANKERYVICCNPVSRAHDINLSKLTSTQ